MSSLKSLSTTCGSGVIPNTQINRSSINGVDFCLAPKRYENSMGEGDLPPFFKKNSVLYHGHYWGLLCLEIPSSAFISCMLVPY